MRAQGYSIAPGPSEQSIFSMIKIFAGPGPPTPPPPPHSKGPAFTTRGLSKLALLCLSDGNAVHITDPEYAKYVLVTNSHNYIRRASALELLPAFGTGLLTTNGKAHAMQRKHLNPAFTATSVKHFITVFNEKAMELVEVRKFSLSLKHE